ncbi:MAG: PHP domain-containing protein, partial [Halanaerobiales bacterium]
MITTIKPGDDYSHIIKYIILDELGRKCGVVTLVEPDNNNKDIEQIKETLRAELTDFSIDILERPTLDKELFFIWPHLIFLLKEKYPYVNGWLERARLKLTENILTIETETNVAYKNLSNEKIKKFIEDQLLSLLETEIILEITNGNFLEEIPVETDISKYQAPIKSNNKSDSSGTSNGNHKSRIIYGGKISKSRTHLLSEIQGEGEIDNIVVEAMIFEVEEINTRRGNTFYVIDMTDNSYSITCKLFPRRDKELNANFKRGSWIKVEGYVQYDKYSKEMVLMADNINAIENKSVNRKDEAEEKRIELHLHTKMSAMDSVVEVKEAIARAAEWGHPALAITDHGVAQSFPEAYWAGKKHGVKIIYGIEAYMVDDGEAIIHNPPENSITDSSFTVFDFETTGLSNDDE